MLIDCLDSWGCSLQHVDEQRGLTPALTTPHYPPYRQVLIDGVQHGALADVPHVRVDGGTSAAARHEAVARFQRDAGVRAALVGITVGGTALTLTAASVAIALELSLQP